MPRERFAGARMFVALAFSFILAGLGHLIYYLVLGTGVSWLGVLQVGVGAGIIGFLVCAWQERGFWYALVTAVLAAVAGGLVGKFMESKMSQILLIFGVEAISAGFIYLGDRLGRKQKALRWIFAVLGGGLAGFLTFGLAGAIISQISDFLKGVSLGLVVIAELALAVPTALLLTRLLLGERKRIKQVEEQE